MQTVCIKDSPLKDYLNLNNHGIVVEVEGIYYQMKTAGSHWKVKYSYEKVGPVGIIMRAAVVQGILKPNLGMQLIVSRETLRAIMEIEKHLMVTYDLHEVVSSIGVDSFKKKIRRCSVHTYAKRMPALKEHMQKNILPALHDEYFSELKKYLFRTDVWSPGPRIRKENHETVACRGLIQLG